VNAMTVVFGVGAYLLGSVPFGLLVGLARGVDVRKVGSGNIGATNVFRTVGKSWGSLAFFLDAAKGFVPAALFPLVLAKLTGAEVGAGHKLLFGCLAIVGHNWPVFLKFKGGKGIATSAGALLGFAPLELGVGVLTWVALFLITRYVSVASIAAALAIPVTGWIHGDPSRPLLPGVLTGLGLVAVLRHRANIRRLMNGTESRFAKKKPAEGRG
jgi:glycerol-3-phosphate acyltransferase PlsY